MAAKRASSASAGSVGSRNRSASRNRSLGPKGARKVSVSIIGAGRLGTALALALAAHGYTIEAVVAGTLRHAGRAAALVGTRPLALSSTRLEELPPSDIIFITTPDDAITATAVRLAAITAQRSSRKLKGVGKGKGNAQRVALHASGALSSDALRSLSEAGFATGSMHPLVSVSDSVHGAESLCSAFFCLEGSRAAIAAARRIIRTFGAQSFSINANDKALYHAAAVMASGHMTALFDIAVELLARCGLTRTRARAVLLPLLRSTLANLYTSDAASALTGTFARADTATVRRHLAALSSKGTQDALAAYTLLGERSLQLAKAAGARSDALQEIAEALSEST